MTSLHWHVITEQMRAALVAFGESRATQRFYLAGGMGLALQLGHRRSVDLDLFSEHDEVRPPTHREVVHALRSFHPVVSEAECGHLVGLLGELQVGFFGYGYPLLEPTVRATGARIARLLDIGLMKLDAVATRGSRKEYCDLNALAPHISLRALLDAARPKYRLHRDFEAMVVRRLTAFAFADREAPVPMASSVSWEEVKTFFARQASSLARSWWDRAEPSLSGAPSCPLGSILT